LQAADGDAGFEEMITLCIADSEGLKFDQVNHARFILGHRWEMAAYGTFLTAFKTLYIWQDSLEK